MKFLKNWVFNCHFRRLVFPAVLMLFVDAGAQAQTPGFDRLKDKFNENEVFEAEFHHEYRDTFTGEHQVTEGTIWVGKDRYKIHSSGNTMVVDNDISRVYDRTKERVIISEYVEEEDDFAPSRMLQGVDDSYSVAETSEDERTVIQLTSSDPFAIFSGVTIYLDSSGIPRRIEAVDQMDNQLITTFERGAFIPEKEEIFRFEHPEDVEIVDLRHGAGSR